MKMVEILSFFAACSTRLLIACFTVRFSRIMIKLVVILLPISSSSKEAITAISSLVSASVSSISSALFSFGIIFRTSITASVSILERIFAAFLTSISSRYSAAGFSSICSKISESISVSRIRQIFLLSSMVRSGNTSARSFSW